MHCPISSDLYTWKNLPIAIAPDKPGDGIFSGSAVLDRNNTTGFFDDHVHPENRFVAIYTLNTDTAQDQHIAYSSDGVTFTKYPGPVLTNNSTQFRDPKVFWDEIGHQWVMTVAHPQEYAIVFYGSPNLKAWTEISRFKTSGFLGYQYECPGLVRVPIEGGPDDGKKLWVLFISINPGAPLGGSAVQYFIGDWDGKTFTPRDAAARVAEFSKDWYAFLSWEGSPDGKLYGIAWASNWQYSETVPTSTFRSVQSLPRELALAYYRPNPLYGDWQLINRPVNLAGISDKTLYSFAADNSIDKATTHKTVDLDGDGGFDIEATFLVPATSNITWESIGSFEIISSKGKESITTGIQMGEPAVLYIDRSNAGEWGKRNPFFTDKTSAILRYQATYPNDRHILGPVAASPFDLPAAEQPSGKDETIKLRAVVDRTVLEVFGNDGLLAGTNTFFFSDSGVPARLKVSLGDGQVQLNDLTVRSIRSTWR